MIFHIIKFELRYWLRQPMLYIFFFIISLMIFGASSSDQITIGERVGNVYKNAPFTVQNYYALMSLICLLMITSFLNSAAARDFSEKTAQIIFSTPIKKFDFIFGRFVGAFLISILPFLGVSVGNIIGTAMPWLDPQSVGPFNAGGHLYGLLVFIVPNLFFGGAIIFCISALTRNTMISFIGAIGLLVGYIISQSMIDDIDSETIGAMLDPFGLRTFSVATKYWTVDDRNSLSMGFEGLLLLNRLVWMLVGGIVLCFTYYRFSFSERSTNVRKNNAQQDAGVPGQPKIWEPLLSVKPEFTRGLARKQFLSQVRLETISILKNTAFIVIVVFGAINLITSMSFATTSYGQTTFPVTYSIVDVISGSFFIFIIAIITFYTGDIVWKERANKVNDIYDALPYPDWIPLVSKTVAVWLMVEVLIIIGVLLGVATQLLNGFTDIRPEVYVVQLMLISGLNFLGLIALSIFIHVMVNNKYLGYFIFIGFVITNSFLWNVLDVSSKLVQFGASPGLTYSDMNGFGPFLTGKLFFESYWLVFCILLLFVSLLYWVRGRETSFSIRTGMARGRWQPNKKYIALFAVVFIALGSWLFYNTRIINQYKTKKQYEQQQIAYEKKYKKYDRYPQPRVTDIRFRIDLFAAERRVMVTSDQWMKNKTASGIDTIFFTLTPDYESTIEIKGATRVIADTLLNFVAYKLPSALRPGDSLLVKFTSRYDAEGIENDVSNSSIVDNGTFFNNADIIPQIGYIDAYEITDKADRRKYDLPPRERVQKLSADPRKRMNTYISDNSDWVNVHTVFTTDPDQIAIAPGSLLRQWKENGRACFEYALDHYSLNFYSFMSARFQVKKKMYKGISIEVYYDARHAYNVDKMLMSMEKSIDYYAAHFGPYYHKQTRIIEFPRYASFAQAFPGTMPYSEAIGFISNLEDEEDIDMVTYVVAHEMGHQWWAHQVCGPDMQGTTLLSESMAQYSALMVMEEMYGKDKMHKFLRYEMDRYLSSRGGERDKECPLMEVENQGYVHYNKASVVMYYLKEMIGKDSVNSALHNLVDSFAYREPPYPTALDLVDRLEQRTPDSLKYLITDLFKKITVFNNRVTEVEVRKEGKEYVVTMEVSVEKMYADSLGREKKIPVRDWIEVGVFARPEGEKRYGRQLVLQQVKFDSNARRFTFRTTEEPYQVGIDPYYYLVDRVPDDNLKKVSL